MKKFLVFAIISLCSTGLQAQTLAPDQNPNYRVSQAKYTSNYDSLSRFMNTTVAQTYKAYDWYEAKQERKQQRISDRRERRLARAYGYNRFNNYNPYNNNYYPYNSYGNRLGYRNNNWFFGW